MAPCLVSDGDTVSHSLSEPPHAKSRPATDALALPVPPGLAPFLVLALWSRLHTHVPVTHLAFCEFSI